MSDWVKATLSDLVAKDEPLTGPHRWKTGGPKLPWPVYCARCGHVRLKNGISTLVNNIGCGYDKDARYKQWLSNGRKPI